MMMQIHNQDDLQKAIADLKRRKAILEVELKENFSSVKQSVTPLSLFKSTFSGFVKVPEFRKIAIGAIVGLVIAFVIRKIRSAIAAAALYKMINGIIGREFERLQAEKPDSYLANVLLKLRSFFRSTSPLYSIFGRLKYNG